MDKLELVSEEDLFFALIEAKKTGNTAKLKELLALYIADEYAEAIAAYKAEVVFIPSIVVQNTIEFLRK